MAAAGEVEAGRPFRGPAAGDPGMRGSYEPHFPAEAAPLSNGGRPWTPEQERLLQQLVAQRLPTRRIGRELGRTATAVASKARQLGLSLKPQRRRPRIQA